jgi:hypothetical protein
MCLHGVGTAALDAVCGIPLVQVLLLSLSFEVLLLLSVGVMLLLHSVGLLVVLFSTGMALLPPSD